ncbi:hypothetical protein [Thermococcus prieurii]
MSVQHRDWGTGGEFDVQLNLGGKYDWRVYVRLVGANVSGQWSVEKSSWRDWTVFTPLSWNRGPTASFGFIVQSGKAKSIVLVVNGKVWDVWPKGAPVPPLNPGNGTNPSPSPVTGSWVNVTNPDNSTSLYVAYKVASDNGSVLTVDIHIANLNRNYTWDGYCFDLRNISFETTGRILSIGYAEGGSPKYYVNGSRVTLDLTWRSVFPLNTSVTVVVRIAKSGSDPVPHNFKVNYLRGPVVYPSIGALPASWRPGNFTLSDLIGNPSEYYSPNFTPELNGVIVCHPPSRTQIIIGLANITYPLNLARGARMWVPNKYFAMGLALAYAWFRINPNYLMALAAKENWGTAVTKDPSFKGFNVTINGQTYHWPVLIDHPDGIFQIESENFIQLTKYYPDLFPTNASHNAYLQVSLNPKNPAWIRSPITAAISLTMERELLYAAIGEKYNEFLREAKDPWAETEILDYGYNRGMGSVAALKVFSSNWEKAVNAPVLWKALNMEGFGGHVPTVVNITATMDMETRDVYDANITWSDIVYFFNIVRTSFFRKGAISQEQWNRMMENVHQAYELLSQHWGGDHISYRYDFLTILRVAMKFWPKPLIPRPTGNDWYYQASNYSP